MKNYIYKYRRFSKAAILFVLFVFSFSSIAADSCNCLCKARQESKKEMKCCNVKKESSCCNSEKSCHSQKPGSKKDCNKCSIKKSDIENPISVNDSKLVKSEITNSSIQLTSVKTVVKGLLTYNTWRPPEKISKIFLELSNFRI